MRSTLTAASSGSRRSTSSMSRAQQPREHGLHALQHLVEVRAAPATAAACARRPAAARVKVGGAVAGGRAWPRAWPQAHASGPSWLTSSSPQPSTTVSMLLISWAMPPAKPADGLEALQPVQLLLGLALRLGGGALLGDVAEDQHAALQLPVRGRRSAPRNRRWAPRWPSLVTSSVWFFEIGRHAFAQGLGHRDCRRLARHAH